MSRESYGGGGQYGMGSSSSSNASSGGGGGRDASQPDFSPPSAGGNNDNKDPTVQYQNTPPLSTEAKEALAAQRQKAQYEISPMTDPKNQAIAIGLSFLFPGAGSLYSAYKNATAMGYSIQNPFKGLLDSDGEITIDKVNQAIERGDGDNFNISEVVASVCVIAKGA